ncbi:MAG TPA: hypothetical protein ENN77_00735 [Candidatus Wirthbacteria bacterium]|nr:hypothetical protein [Candidatus Wirthbacteria bacterium]
MLKTPQTSSIPTFAQCQQIWDELHTAPNVRRHSQLVADIAVYLGKRLIEAGETMDLTLVEAGALLHDALRFVGMPDIKLSHFAIPPSFEDIRAWQEQNQKYAGLNHAQAICAELLARGYDKSLADVIRKHDFDRIIDPEDGVDTWEQKLVFYADKRVCHDQIVILKERFQDIIERYPRFAGDPDHQLKFAAIFDLEEELFRLVGLEADRLGEYLD